MTNTSEKKVMKRTNEILIELAKGDKPSSKRNLHTPQFNDEIEDVVGNQAAAISEEL